MNADQLAKFVRQALVTRGFQNQIPIAKAREIRSGLLRDVANKGYKQQVIVELAITYINGKTMCDCAKTKVVVKPVETKQVHIKK
jgi:hypothetical protein